MPSILISYWKFVCILLIPLPFQSAASLSYPANEKFGPSARSGLICMLTHVASMSL